MCVWFVLALDYAPEDHRGAGGIASHALGVAMRSAQDVHGIDERASAVEIDSGGLPWRGASQEDHPWILVLRFHGSPTDDPGLNGALVGRRDVRRRLCICPPHPCHPPKHRPGGDVDGHLFPFTLGVACMFGCVVCLGWFGSSPVLLGKESTPTSTWTSTSPR